jgi:hypothetical protein
MIQLLLFFAEWFGKCTEKVSGGLESLVVPGEVSGNFWERSFENWVGDFSWNFEAGNFEASQAAMKRKQVEVCQGK